MKNNISQKYSIIILIILILILVYIHIPNPPNVMRGGAELAAEIKNMIKNDAIYSYTLGHPIIQWVILVVIIGLIIGAYFTAIGPFTWTGAPAIGVTGISQSFSQLGPGFLKKFYILTNDTFINRTNGQAPTYPDDMDIYKNNLVDFKTTMKPQINVFCNAVQPCNKCKCPGYTGIECGPAPGTPGAQIVKANSKAAEKFMGFVPKCCCLQTINSQPWKYVTDTKVAADKTHPCWIPNTRPNSAYLPDQVGGQPNITTYSWDNNTASCQKLLSSGTNNQSPEIHGCDVSDGTLTDPNNPSNTATVISDVTTLSTPIAGTDGTPAAPSCTCPDGDPTLNYYEILNDTTSGLLKPSDSNALQKTNLEILFITWGNLDIKSGQPLGTTEKSYRATSASIPSLPFTLPPCYYDSNKKLLAGATDSNGYLYNNITDNKTPPNIVIDPSTYDPAYFSPNNNTTFCNSATSGTPASATCPADGSGSLVGSSTTKVKLLYDASYMNGVNKYLYVIPKSTFNDPDLTQPDPDFKMLVKSQLASLNLLPSNSNNAPSTNSFFGGIYNSIFSPNK